VEQELVFDFVPVNNVLFIFAKHTRWKTFKGDNLVSFDRCIYSFFDIGNDIGVHRRYIMKVLISFSGGMYA